MFPSRYQTLQDQNLEVFKHVAALSAHDLHKLGRQFERRALEAEVFRRARENEAVVDVQNVPLDWAELIERCLIYLIPSHLKLRVDFLPAI